MTALILMGIISGLCATYVMDICAKFLVRRGYIDLKGLQIVPPLLGRWIIVFLKTGKLVHADIRMISTQKNERLLGWINHYVIGAFLGVFFSLFSPENTILAGIFYGILTNIFPWLLMYPSMGFGFFGKKLPASADILKFSLVNHIIYGLSLGFALAVLHKFFN